MFEKKLFDVEHALMMHATSFAYLPAAAIYDKNALAPLMRIIRKCHIYIIGFMPKINFVNACQRGRDLITSYEVLGKTYDVVWDLPMGANLHKENELWHVSDALGRRGFPSEQVAIQRLNAIYGLLNFHVKYIGQAYGEDGSRNALDRLQKHETLQEISLRGLPSGHRLELILLEVEPSNKVMTALNPHAIDRSHSDARIHMGLEKLFNTSEKERVSLYEAAFIRYFKPQYNIEFKNSFPSTNLKILKDCYDKDFSAVMAEMTFDDWPFSLYSEKVAAKHFHIAYYDLHNNEDRKMFFS